MHTIERFGDITQRPDTVNEINVLCAF